MENNGVIHLSGGRDVQITSIRQWFTYGGLLEGLPTDKMNRQMIDRLLKEERERGWWAGEPYLVPPPVRTIQLPDDRSYPFGTPEAFPPITCVARLISVTPARDPKKDTSELTVIWFQDEYAFPIDPQVLEHLRRLDWDNRAIDLEL